MASTNLQHLMCKIGDISGIVLENTFISFTDLRRQMKDFEESKTVEESKAVTETSKHHKIFEIVEEGKPVFYDFKNPSKVLYSFMIYSLFNILNSQDEIFEFDIFDGQKLGLYKNIFKNGSDTKYLIITDGQKNWYYNTPVIFDILKIFERDLVIEFDDEIVRYDLTNVNREAALERLKAFTYRKLSILLKKNGYSRTREQHISQTSQNEEEKERDEQLDQQVEQASFNDS